jgi:hypothetical protein
MSDINSKDTHVIQAMGKDGSWKNMTRHAGLKDAKSNMPAKNPQNYRIQTLKQAGLSKPAGDMGNSSKTEAYQSGKVKKPAAAKPAAAKPAAAKPAAAKPVAAKKPAAPKKK